MREVRTKSVEVVAVPMKIEDNSSDMWCVENRGLNLPCPCTISRLADLVSEVSL